MIFEQIGKNSRVFVKFWQTKANKELNNAFVARNVDTEKVLLLCNKRIKELQKCIKIIKELESENINN